MPTFLTLESQRGTLPSWWDGELPIGHAVELEVYGDRMIGRLRDAEGDTIQITIPVAEQVPGLMLSTAHGTAVISLAGGAVRVPVSCWSGTDVIRLQVIGPAQFIQRRLHSRLTIKLPVSLAWLRAGERVWDHARSHTVDLSLGGVQIASATTVWPPSGVAVQVQLDLPDGPCQVHAEVVGTTPDYGLRLVFTDVDPQVAERLRRLTA
jgi:c-di-GMP-binding flagellar brake protein YcgR